MFTPASTAPAAPAGGADVRSFAAAIMDATGAVLTGLLNRRVDVELATVEPDTVGALAAAVPPPWVLARVPYTRGLAGTQWLVLSAPDGLHLAEALRGGEASAAAALEARHLDALRDALSQVCTAAGPALMPALGRSVACGPATVSVAEAGPPAELGAATDGVVLARARVSVEGGPACALLLVTDDELVREIGAATAAAPAGTGDEGAPGRLDLILDVTLPVTVELGRARMQIQEVLKLVPGSVIELDKLAGDPVDLYINDRPIAKGEVVIIDESFGIRLTSIVTASERVKSLR
jgi:flagellar motor switch protein FliN/FliY